MSKVKVITATSTEIGSASYLPSGKAYKRQTWFIDGVRRLVSPTSAMTSKVKGQCSDFTWCVWQLLAHKSRTQNLRNTEIGRLPTLWAILRICFTAGSKVKVSRETESVSYLRSGKTYELQHWYADGACYQLPRPAIKTYEVGFLHAGGGIPCQPNPAATQLVIIIIIIIIIIIT